MSDKKGIPQLLPNITTVTGTYNAVNDVRDIAAYNPQDTPDTDEQAEIAAEDVADQLDSENKDSLDSFDSIDEPQGLIGDDDDYGLKLMKNYDKAQREELESKMGTPALVDMRKMKKEHYPSFSIMTAIAQAMGASKKKKKKKKKKKRKRTEKKDKEKKGAMKMGKSIYTEPLRSIYTEPPNETPTISSISDEAQKLSLELDKYKDKLRICEEKLQRKNSEIKSVYLEPDSSQFLVDFSEEELSPWPSLDEEEKNIRNPQNVEPKAIGASKKKKKKKKRKRTGKKDKEKKGKRK